jgi:hypothetical protein
MSSPENLALEITMRDLYDNPEEFISADQCETGTIYWSNSAQIGQVALCAGLNNEGCVVAIGLGEQREGYKLQYEFHKNTPTGSHTGYWRPHVALPWATEGVPDDVIIRGIEEYFSSGSGAACRKLFNLLLDTEIEVTQDKIDWLTSSLPQELRKTHAYQEILEINQINLVELEHLRDEQTDSGANILLCQAAAVRVTAAK